MATDESVPPVPGRSTRRRLVAALVGGAAVIAACTPAPDEPAPVPTRIEQLPARIEEYLSRTPSLDDNVRAVLVTVDGESVVDLYRDTTPDEYRFVASVTKSVLSTLVGIAVGEELLDLDTTLPDLLPRYAAAMSPDLAVTTLRDLLTMTGPFRRSDATGWEPQGDDWVGDTLATADRSPGTFAYSDSGVHVVSAVLAEATGMSVLDYGRQKLFDPLGIDTAGAPDITALPENIQVYEDADFAWPVDPQGVHLGASLLKLQPEDMLQIGTLYLDEGRWDGRQVVPPEWVRDATTEQVPVRRSGVGDGYGYLWWVDETFDGHATFLAWGYGGQLIEVVPDLGLVAVVSTESDLVTGQPLDPSAFTFNIVSQLVIPAAEELRDAGR